ncbi:MAG: Integral membrane protein, partial [uncultured Arthrobacter sp.]
ELGQHKPAVQRSGAFVWKRSAGQCAGPPGAAALGGTAGATGDPARTGEACSEGQGAQGAAAGEQGRPLVGAEDGLPPVGRPRHRHGGRRHRHLDRPGSHRDLRRGQRPAARDRRHRERRLRPAAVRLAGTGCVLRHHYRGRQCGAPDGPGDAFGRVVQHFLGPCRRNRRHPHRRL